MKRMFPNSGTFRLIARLFFLVLVLFSLSGCFSNKLTVYNPNQNNKSLINIVPTVTDVKVLNHQIIITGTNLNNVSQFVVKDGNAATTLQIETQTANQIVANTLSNVTFAAGKLLDFVLSSADASATFSVNFSLCDSSLGGKAFDCTAIPNNKDVLSYDASTGKWMPRSINGLNYVGAWDASTGVFPTAVSPGDYFIVNVASAPYLVGDWIVYNGTSFDRVSNSTAITSVFGRTGVVVATKGDYNLDKLTDVDLTTIAPVANQVLQYNGTKWVPGTVSAGSGGTVTMVSGTAPISVSNGASTPSISMTQASGITAGYVSSGDWNTFNNKEPSVAAGTTAQYYRGDKTFVALNTSVVPENTNLYFTNARVLGVPLTGFSATNSAIVATDTTLAAFGKAQGQINSLNTSLTTANTNLATKADLTNVSQTITTASVTGLSTPFSGSDAANKTYVDTQVATAVPKLGGTMSGDLQVNTKVKFQDSTTNTVSIKAPTAATSYVMTLPGAVASSAGQMLTSDTSGNLSWTTPASSATPSGAAGGSLAGTYPNPTIAAGAITDASVSATAAIAESKIANLTSDLAGKEPTLTSGTTAQYYRGDKSWQTLNSDVAVEGTTNLYFTNARVLGVPLTGFSATNSAIVATDTTLVAFGKAQGQINAHAITIGNKADLTNGSQSITASNINVTTINGSAIPLGSQWTTNGTRIGYTNGNVGIGTTSPQSPLNITNTATATANYGTVSIGSAPFDGTTSGFFVGSSSGTVLAINAPSTFTGNLIDLQLGGGTSLFNVNKWGNITNSGSVASAAGGYFGGGVYSQNGTLATATSTNLSIFPNDGSGAVAMTILSSNGNVGVGTASPSEKLQVTGNIIASGALKLQDSTTNYVSIKANASTTPYNFILPATKGTNGQVLQTDGNGNLSWLTVSAGGGPANTDALTEGSTNLYFTNSRAIASTISAPTLTNSAIASGDTIQDSLGKLQAQFNNVLNIALSGLSTATNAVITSSDSLLVALGKIQAQISGHSTSLATDASNIFQLQTSVSNLTTSDSGKLALTGGSLTGNLQMDAQSSLLLSDSGSNKTVAIRAPASVTTSYTLNMPTAQGAASTVLTNDGSGNLSWAAASGGGGGSSDASTLTGTTLSSSVTSSSLTSFGANPNIGAATGTSLVVTGNIDGLSNVAITTTTTNAVEVPEKMNIYYFNNYATAATAVSYTLPSAVAGKQRCYSHYIGQTGILTINAAAGQYIIFRGVASSSGGYANSSGSLGDAACFVGVDSTHWMMYVNNGVWIVQ